MTKETLQEIAEIMQSNRGISGSPSARHEETEEYEDWSESLDDNESSYWEDFLGGPDDDQIVAYNERAAVYDDEGYDESPLELVEEPMQLHPQGVRGPWKSGIVLDWHTIDSKCVGENEFGHPIFETTRSELGELLYRFKYKNDQAALAPLVEAAARYLEKAKDRFRLLVPVPPSNLARKDPPTILIAQGIGKLLSIEVVTDAIRKTVSTPQLKSVHDPEKRQELLAGAHVADPDKLNGKSILLVDDLYRSGATMAAITKVAYDQGKVSAVYVFALTRTRVNQ